MITAKSKRSENRQTQAVQKLVTFQIRQEWFALPIRWVRKLTVMGPVYGATGKGSMGLTHFENLEIPVIDAQHRIFGSATTHRLPPSQTPAPPPLAQLPASLPDHRPQQANVQPETDSLDDASSVQRPQPYLLVVQNQRGELMGLPLATQPVLRRVPESAFAPLPTAYSAGGSLRCVRAIAALGQEQPSLFLLDLNQLMT